MTRLGPTDTIIVKPSSNIYTVLVAVATVVVVLGLVAIWMKSEELFGGLLKAPPQQQTVTRSR